MVFLLIGLAPAVLMSALVLLVIPLAAFRDLGWVGSIILACLAWPIAGAFIAVWVGLIRHEWLRRSQEGS